MSRAKIKSIAAVREIARALRKKNRSIVFTNGCFDILHWGHVKYLQDAKAKGDVLIVGVNSDASVKRIKGNKRPIIGEKDRLNTIAGLQSVDYVVKFNEDTPLRLIKSIRPSVLIKGADWNKKNIVGADLVKDNGGKVITVKIVRGRSTSSIIKKIAHAYK